MPILSVILMIKRQYKESNYNNAGKRISTIWVEIIISRGQNIGKTNSTGRLRRSKFELLFCLQKAVQVGTKHFWDLSVFTYASGLQRFAVKDQRVNILGLESPTVPVAFTVDPLYPCMDSTSVAPWIHGCIIWRYRTCRYRTLYYTIS